MKQRLVLAIFLILLGAWSTRAQAQDESLNRARAAFDNGQSLFQEGKFLEAAQEFQSAYEARPFGQFLFNIGACYEKANDYPKALDYYARYIEAKPSDEDVAKTQTRIEVLKKAVADQQAGTGDPTQPSEAVQNLDKVELRGLVVIESEPQGASIYLDTNKSKPLSKTPWNGTLSGEHLIILERKGYKSVEKNIRPDPNKLLVLFWGLAEEDYLGWVDVSSNVPGADIYIDDKSIGAKAKTPWAGNLEPGKHTIWVTKEGYNEYETTIEVIAGETQKVAASLEGSEVGYLNVRGKGVENYKIVVDGKTLCKRGPCLKPLPPGKHRVSIKRDGHKSYSQRIEIQSKTEVTMRATLEKDPSRMDAVLAYVFTAAFVGGGYWAGTKADDLKNELQAEIDAGNPPPDSQDPRYLRGKIYAITADSAYAIGGMTFLAAIYYTLRDKGKPSTGSSDIRAITFEPSIAPDYAGLGLQVSF